ncbi:MAG: TrmH family RNA methyltransferase [Calditrichaeota bacterium]|nr:RNA methyltransferase [Calditrichota bacterium]RQW05347.1 MAG: TrmH family RNA methyltransferase [Calditrichota bacterium]
MRKLSYEEITARRLNRQEIQRAERFPIITLLDNIRSLHNVGSIFRTADAVRLKKLYLCGITGNPPRKEIDKTALGAVDTVPWEYREDAVQLVKELKQEGVQMVALEHTSESRPFDRIDIRFPVCLVVGNEVFGIQDKIVELADTAVEIPMYGTKQSLNVTIAYGIVIYRLLDQFLAQNK